MSTPSRHIPRLQPQNAGKNRGISADPLFGACRMPQSHLTLNAGRLSFAVYRPSDFTRTSQSGFVSAIKIGINALRQESHQVVMFHASMTFVVTSEPHQRSIRRQCTSWLTNSAKNQCAISSCNNGRSTSDHTRPGHETSGPAFAMA